MMPQPWRTQARIILTSLPDAEAVREATLGSHGITMGLKRDRLVVDTSTTSPAEARALATDLAARGVAFLDAPVSGGVHGAAAGTLSIMVGGPEPLVAQAHPVLSCLGGTIVHCGPIGAGQVTKACNQLVVMATHESVAEALLLAEASGLDPWLVRDALMAGYAASPILDIQGPRMIERDFTPGGKAKFHLKDIATISELAHEVGLDLPAFNAAARQVERLIDAGGGELDNSALISAIASRHPRKDASPGSGSSR